MDDIRIDTVQAAGTLWTDMGSVDDRHALLYLPGLRNVLRECAAKEIRLRPGITWPGVSLLPLGARHATRSLAITPVLHSTP